MLNLIMLIVGCDYSNHGFLTSFTELNQNVHKKLTRAK